MLPRDDLTASADVGSWALAANDTGLCERLLRSVGGVENYVLFGNEVRHSAVVNEVYFILGCGFPFR